MGKLLRRYEHLSSFNLNSVNTTLQLTTRMTEIGHWTRRCHICILNWGFRSVVQYNNRLLRPQILDVPTSGRSYKTLVNVIFGGKLFSKRNEIKRKRNRNEIENLGAFCANCRLTRWVTISISQPDPLCNQAHRTRAWYCVILRPMVLTRTLGNKYSASIAKTDTKSDSADNTFFSLSDYNKLLV